MIDPNKVVDSFKKKGFKNITGVPCSYLTPFVHSIIDDDDINYVAATNEGQACAIAAGWRLAGASAVVFCQNSGLGNMVSPITSLNLVFELPVLFLVTWRGCPGTKDEPQHLKMGEITTDLLQLLGIPFEVLEIDASSSQINNAMEYILESGKSFALLIKDNLFRDVKSNLDESDEPYPKRIDVLERISRHANPQAILVATTGKTGRELYSIDDKNNQIYCVGSMGLASALAFGISQKYTKHVYLIDGDGAALMHMGNFATIGAHGASNLLHFLLDNECHDSTGGQPTVSNKIDFPSVAKSCGYRNAITISNISEIEELCKSPPIGPALIYVRISKGSKLNLPRPSVTPSDVSKRLLHFINRNK